MKRMPANFSAASIPPPSIGTLRPASLTGAICSCRTDFVQVRNHWLGSSTVEDFHSTTTAPLNQRLGTTSTPNPDSHHVKVMVVGPHVQSHTQSQCAKSGVDQSNVLIGESPHRGARPRIIFRHRIHEGPVGHLCQPT